MKDARCGNTWRGTAARLDPTQVRVVDLSETRIDPFARDLRKSMRKKHGIDCSQHVGITAVYSEEPPIEPHELAYDTDGFRCVCPGGQNGVNDCDHKNRVEGSVAFVPSVFGMTAAGAAVKLLVGLPLTARTVDGVRVPVVRADEPAHLDA